MIESGFVASANSKVVKSSAHKRPPNAGKGRRRGSRNKLTQGAKKAFEIAFEGVGGAAALAEWANANKTEFYKLYARLIPVEQRHADPHGDPMQITVTFV